MRKAKQRASVGRALTSDATQMPAPPSAAALLDWLEARALAVSSVRRTSADQVAAELAWRVQRERARLVELLKADESRALPGVPAGLRFRLTNRSEMREYAQVLHRAAASLRWVGRARTALVKGDSDALACFVLLAERSFHDPASERAEHSRRERLRRIAVRGGRGRGRPLLSRNADLERDAVELARRKPKWSVTSIATELAKGQDLSATRIAAIIRPVVRKFRSTPAA